MFFSIIPSFLSLCICSKIITSLWFTLDKEGGSWLGLCCPKGCPNFHEEPHTSSWSMLSTNHSSMCPEGNVQRLLYSRDGTRCGSNWSWPLKSGNARHNTAKKKKKTQNNSHWCMSLSFLNLVFFLGRGDSFTSSSPLFSQRELKPRYTWDPAANFKSTSVRRKQHRTSSVHSTIRLHFYFTVGKQCASFKTSFQRG